MLLFLKDVHIQVTSCCLRKSFFVTFVLSSKVFNILLDVLVGYWVWAEGAYSHSLPNAKFRSFMELCEASTGWASCRVRLLRARRPKAVLAVRSHLDQGHLGLQRDVQAHSSLMHTLRENPDLSGLRLTLIETICFFSISSDSALLSRTSEPSGLNTMPLAKRFAESMPSTPRRGYLDKSDDSQAKSLLNN